MPRANSSLAVDLGRRGVLEHPDAAAVVAAARRLEHHRPASGRVRRRRLRPGIATTRRGRHGHSRPPRSAPAGGACPGRAPSSPPTGRAGGPPLPVGLQVRGGHEFVVEREQYVAARRRRRPAQRRAIGRRADGHVGRYQRRAVVRLLGQEANRDGEGDRGLERHPRQLSRPHDPDGRAAHQPLPVGRSIPAAGGTGYRPSGRRRPGCSIVCRRHATRPHVVGTAATGLAPNDSGWQLRR